VNYPELIFKQMVIGPMANYQYFIGDEKTKEIGIVDPAWNEDFLMNEAEKNGYQIRCILLTHGHYDHTDAVEAISTKLNIPTYISKYENVSQIPRCENINKTGDNEKIRIGEIEIDCLHTPGHSPGCQCFKYKDILITGDTLFVDGCGRCDLPGGDARKMHNSLYNVLMKLDDETIIHPGHQYGPSPSATLKDQKSTNPYLKNPDINDFLRKRMGL